ncbi:Grx4 family monothiol glutaredoxin [Methylotuvimicrobium buryatense]|uniref:Grx4 family monothiol glutaredoxin n=1 Tax=Methylotuvimicrobium buryatense TaxID=95641 RepID=A0A4P9UQZ5_METBY|nr:Grx4 family monothiol glutaredoxin [Methylotuvimicrobium buryatense]QCW83777.1 Grx4 family monothiol glutaredoxin [Methylotuvimicrobium buryatense]
MSTEDKIRKQLAENPIILYMKGVPTAPECGFSAKTVGILNATGIPFAYVNVLAAPFIREKLPKISHWPTYPQLFVNGELVGGCDIVEAMHNDGSLLLLLQNTSVKTESTAAAGDAITHVEVESLIKNSFPDAVIEIDGEGCNLSITVVSEAFLDLPLVKQQQGVMAALAGVLASGRLHAVSMKTFTPEQRREQAETPASGLLQIQA